MTYHLSWRDFEDYARKRDASPDTTMPADAGGETRARTFVWNQFRRCYDSPIPGRSLFPKPGSCEPAVYNDAAHWDSVFKRLVRRRTIDAHKSDASGAVLLGPSTPEADDDPWNILEDRGADLEESAEVTLVLEKLKDAVLHQFPTTVPYGPEIQQALLVAVYNFKVGEGGSLYESVNKDLQEQLAESLGTSEKGRAARSRAVRRARAFVAETLG